MAQAGWVENEFMLAGEFGAAAWLTPREGVDVPPGTLGGRPATDRLADMILAGQGRLVGSLQYELVAGSGAGG
jgi:hypothetical protein